MSDLMLIRERFGLTEQEIEHIQTAGYVFKVEMYPYIHDQQDLTQRVLKLVRALRPGLR